MSRRIFVGISLAADTRQAVESHIAKWRWLPIRWMAPENWHITIVPPYALDDEQIAALSSLLLRSRLGGPITVSFSRILLAPRGGPARMIWLEGPTSPALTKLKERIESLWEGESKLPALISSERPLHLHITLARFEPGALRELEAKTRILGEVEITYEVPDVSIFEEKQEPADSRYTMVRTAAL